MASLERLRQLLRTLRDPQRGCPWDLEQTFETIAPYTIEEAYEVEDAIRRSAFQELCGELGDLLLQVVYHSQLAEEAGHFELEQVVDAICTKLIDRHPHVFGPESRPEEAARVVGQWEARKAEERRARGARSAFDEIPLGLPALARTAKLMSRARRAELDSTGALRTAEGPLGAVDLVLPEALDEAQFGALLGTVARRAAEQGVDPEHALRRENARLEQLLRNAEARNPPKSAIQVPKPTSDRDL